MRIFLAILLLLLPALAFGSTGIGILVEEADGDPAGFAYKQVFPNGSMSLSNAVATISPVGFGPESLSSDYGCDLTQLTNTYISSPVSVWVDCDYSLTGDLTVDEDVTLLFEAGNTITLGAYSLYLRSEVYAGRYQIFDDTGAGSVHFWYDSTQAVYPEWWGAQVGAVGAVTGDDTAEIQSAIDSSSNNYHAGIVSFASGQYDVTGAITLKSNTRLTGSSYRSPGTRILHDPASGSYLFTGTDVRGVIIEHMNLVGDYEYGNLSLGAIKFCRDSDYSYAVYLHDLTISQFRNSAAVPILIEYTIRPILERIYVSCTGALSGIEIKGTCSLTRIVECDASGGTHSGIRLTNDSNHGASSVLIEQCSMHGNQYGLYTGSMNEITAQHNYFEDNTVADIYVPEEINTANHNTGPIRLVQNHHNGDISGGACIGYDIHGKNVTIQDASAQGNFSNAYFCHLRSTSSDCMLIGGKRWSDARLAGTGYTLDVLQDDGSNNTLINFMDEEDTAETTYIRLDGTNSPTTGVIAFGDDIHGPSDGCTTATSFTINSGPPAYDGTDYDDNLGFGMCGGGPAMYFVDETGMAVFNALCEPGTVPVDYIDTYGAGTGANEDVRLCAFSFTDGDTFNFSVLMPKSQSCSTLATAWMLAEENIIAQDEDYYKFNSTTCEYELDLEDGWSIVSSWPQSPTLTDDAALSYYYIVGADGDAELQNLAIDADLTVADDVTVTDTVSAGKVLAGNLVGSVGDVVLAGSQLYTATESSGFYNAFSSNTAINSTLGSPTTAVVIGTVAYANDGNSTDNFTDAVLGGVLGGYWQAEHTGSGLVNTLKSAEFRVTTYGSDSGNVTHGISLYPTATQELGSTSSFGSYDGILIEPHPDSPADITGDRVGVHIGDLDEGANNYGILIEEFTDTTNDWGIWSDARAGFGDGIPIYFGTDQDIGLSSNSDGQLDLTPLTGDGPVTLDVVGAGELVSNQDTTVNGDLDVTAGTVQADSFAGTSGTVGITDNSSYWLCTAVDCTSTCQVTIEDGLITGCP